MSLSGVVVFYASKVGTVMLRSCCMAAWVDHSADCGPITSLYALRMISVPMGDAVWRFGRCKPLWMINVLLASTGTHMYER